MGTQLFSKRYIEPHQRHRKKRPKTFQSAEAANVYAKKHHITKYDLVNMHPFKTVPKIKIVVK